MAAHFGGSSNLELVAAKLEQSREASLEIEQDKIVVLESKLKQARCLPARVMD